MLRKVHDPVHQKYGGKHTLRVYKTSPISITSVSFAKVDAAFRPGKLKSKTISWLHLIQKSMNSPGLESENKFHDFFMTFNLF